MSLNTQANTPSQANQQPLASRIFVALDVPSQKEALSLVEQLAPLGLSFKIGMQLFYAEGMGFVQAVQNQLKNSPSSELFIDLKLHDIPTTVGKASESLVRHDVSFFNVHTTGGKAMMQAAREYADKTADSLGQKRPTIIAVTVLTSMDETTLKQELNVSNTVLDQVGHLAKLTQSAGLDGVVCSAQEAGIIQQVCGKDFLKVTPGIRMPDDNVGDQSRILTPQKAFETGATHLVIGRPITQADNPVKAAERILESL
jgi:orotidine-5'-phosphate decarboxylase